jgi:ketosteroid isomerase-like protein
MNLEEENNVAATTKEVLRHHLNSFDDSDIISTMADYSSESKFFTPEGVLRGPEAIRSFFVKMFEEFNKPGTSFEMLRQEVDGETAYIVWRAETAVSRYEVGTDTFIVRNGKIVTQTFAGKISPKR